MALPGHIAIIMDGNGRWAERRGLPRIEGHRKGADAVHDTVRACREFGLDALTLYAFSTQNWERPPDEVGALMWLLADFVHKEREEILDRQIRLTTIGEIDRLPAFVQVPLRALIAESAHNREMTLCLALSYGARENIVAAAQKLAAAAVAGKLDPAAIDERALAGALATADLPPVDLVIRTSGEQRLSNFLLWEAAYAELYFTDVAWPDFTRGELMRAIAAFERRDRRFGLTGAQAQQRRAGSK
jgi:undecaprenyl diphosphate synthase